MGISSSTILSCVLDTPGAADRIDDIAVEWGNALYQGVVDRYVNGDSVPWDSVTMAWRNTIVSPNTVWDAPVYERFFRQVRRINASLPPASRYRILLADSPVDWAQIDSVPQLQPFFERTESIAGVVRRESLQKGRRCLLLAGGLHVSRIPRVRRSSLESQSARSLRLRGSNSIIPVRPTSSSRWAAPGA